MAEALVVGFGSVVALAWVYVAAVLIGRAWYATGEGDRRG